MGPEGCKPDQGRNCWPTSKKCSYGSKTTKFTRALNVRSAGFSPLVLPDLIQHSFGTDTSLALGRVSPVVRNLGAEDIRLRRRKIGRDTLHGMFVFLAGAAAEVLDKFWTDRTNRTAKRLIFWRSLGDSNPCFRRERATS
jgi:hypothetical protein